jgi:vacuolar-type H+-ATPase subunit I/STV1
MGYEFNESDSKVMLSLSSKLLLGAILMSLGMVIVIIEIIRGDWDGIFITLRIIQGLTQVITAVMLLLAIPHFRNVAKTKGSDIKELMEAIKKMSLGFFVIFIAIITAVITDVIMLVSF